MKTKIKEISKQTRKQTAQKNQGTAESPISLKQLWFSFIFLSVLFALLSVQPSLADEASCPAELRGLWVQSSPVKYTDRRGREVSHCGCRELGLSSGTPRPCFYYFGENHFSGGYLLGTAYRETLDTYQCADDPKISDTNIQRIIKTVEKPREDSSLVLSLQVSGAVGKCEVVRQGEVTLEDEVFTDGTHLDMIYRPKSIAARLTRRDRICTSYIFKEGEFYLAGDPSAGGKKQPDGAEACDDARFTNLIRFTKVSASSTASAP